jgi:hypothetical protein
MLIPFFIIYAGNYFQYLIFKINLKLLYRLIQTTSNGCDKQIKTALHWKSLL